MKPCHPEHSRTSGGVKDLQVLFDEHDFSGAFKIAALEV